MPNHRLLILLICLMLTGCSAQPDLPVRANTRANTPAAPTSVPTFFAASNTPAADSLPIADPTPAPTADNCAETSGRVESIEVPSQLLPRPLQVRLYLPPCFDPQAAQPYPLLVLLHGQTADASQWEHLGVPTRADALISRGVIPPLLVAMPYEQDSLADPNESPYAQALVEELLPWLSEHYAACNQRACRAVGGLSRGAAWAVRAALGFAQPFTALGMHSPAPFYGDYNRLPYQVREIAPGNLPALWMDTGSRDRYLSQARHYHGLLQDYAVPHEYHLFAGEHDEIYWTRGVERYLRWYGKQLAAPEPLP